MISSLLKDNYNKSIDLLKTECGMPYATAHVARVKRVTAARLFLKEVIGYERSQNRFNIWPY